MHGNRTSDNRTREARDAVGARRRPSSLGALLVASLVTTMLGCSVNALDPAASASRRALHDAASGRVGVGSREATATTALPTPGEERSPLDVEFRSGIRGHGEQAGSISLADTIRFGPEFDR